MRSKLYKYFITPRIYKRPAPSEMIQNFINHLSLRNMSLDIPLLLALPTELLLKVLMHLPNLHSILLASSTCKRIRQIYRFSVLQIMRSLIAQTGDPHSAHSIYIRLRILGGVIIMFKLKVALSLFKDGWELFATNDYKQFLIPFGVAMARASILEKHQNNQAVRLLRDILDHKRPFTWECTSRDPFSNLLHLLSPDPLFYSTTNASSPVKPEDLSSPFQGRFSRVPKITGCYNSPGRG